MQFSVLIEKYLKINNTLIRIKQKKYFEDDCERYEEYLVRFRCIYFMHTCEIYSG